MSYCLLHLTDLHLNPLNKIPSAVNENYHSIVKDEFNELKNRVDSLKLKYSNVIVCISGDIFNLKSQNLYIPKVIEYYSNLIENTFIDCKVY